MAYTNEIVTKFRTEGVANVANAVKQMQGAVSNFGKQMATTGDKMIAWGKNTQWLGRQLLYNVTLPIVGIGVASVKMALDVEKQWVRVRKVYGDAGTSTKEIARVQSEILEPAVKRVSEAYAIQQKEILDIMATYAAAGKVGQELADITEETLRIMTLGEIEVASATNFLKNMMATYQMSVADAMKEINAFNTIENETYLQMKDLSDAFPVASGAFKGFNLTAREGAATIAGIAQRTGTANEAANALKFSFSRLAGGMPIVNKTLEKHNIQLFDATGNMRKGTDVLRDLAKRFSELNDKERQEMLSRLFGNRQIVRMRALLEAVNDPMSDYNKALKVSADNTTNASVAQNELNTILNSAPKEYERNLIILQNLGIELGAKLLPILNNFMKKALIPLVEWLSKLSPGWQNFILGTLGVVAAIGPLLIIVASVAEIIGLFTNNTGKLIAVLSGSRGLTVATKSADSVMLNFGKSVGWTSKAMWSALGIFGLVITAMATVYALSVKIQSSDLPNWLKKVTSLMGAPIGPAVAM